MSDTRTPAPMTEEGTTVPQDAPIADQFDPGETVIVSDTIVFDDPVEDDTEVVTEPDATAGEPEPDPATTDPEPMAAAVDEQVDTEEYAAVDTADEAVVVPADDGSGVEDADVETPVDEAAPDDEVASADQVAAAVPAEDAAVDEPEQASAVDDAPATDAAPESAAADTSESDFLIGHVFDQTNGVIEGIDGDSDGTARSDEESSADRHGMNEPNPVGQQDAWKDDHYGADDGRDPNP